MVSNEMANVDAALSNLYKTETHEQLERFTEILLGLEQNPQGQNDVINELFRLAHNIKGSSGMMGLDDLKETMHQVENLFDGVRKGLSNLTPEIIDQLIQYSDEVMTYVENGEWSNTAGILRWNNKFTYQPAAATTSPNRFNTSLALSEQEKMEIAKWQEAGKDVYGIEMQFNLDAEMKAASAMVFIKFLEKFGSLFKTAPPVEELIQEKFDIVKTVLLTEHPLTDEQEKSICTYPVNDVVDVQLRKWAYRPEESQAKVVKVENQFERTIRVESVKIDKLINNVGELLTVKASLLQLMRTGNQGVVSWNQLSKITQKLEQITTVFQTEVMDLRMIPVRQLFSRFPKMGRDVAKHVGKQVEMVVFGEETEIDKHVAEQLVDPLTHLIRNAVDHGLEDAAGRRALNKPETGKVTLGAYQDGDYIVISVSDDGAGLNLIKIREKALKNGLIKPDEQLPRDEVLKLIFRPGFSTTEQVSDISGRGVGLDVVQSSIKALKGDIEIDTEINRGTTFRLKVPLTLAIIQSFMVKVGGQIFGIPSADVVESLVIDPVTIRPVGDKNIYTLRDEALPLIDLADFFHMKTETSSDKIPLLVARNGRNKLGLLVGELLGQEEIMIKQINSALPDNPVIAGAAMLGSGEISLILNVHQIFRKSFS